MNLHHRLTGGASFYLQQPCSSFGTDKLLTAKSRLNFACESQQTRLFSRKVGTDLGILKKFLALRNRYRDCLIAQALGTHEGRVALAEAMVAPIRAALNYQSIGRKLLMVDELPQGALARYETEINLTLKVLNQRKP